VLSVAKVIEPQTVLNIKSQKQNVQTAMKITQPTGKDALLIKKQQKKHTQKNSLLYKGYNRNQLSL